MTSAADGVRLALLAVDLAKNLDWKGVSLAFAPLRRIGLQAAGRKFRWEDSESLESPQDRAPAKRENLAGAPRGRFGAAYTEVRGEDSSDCT